MSVSVTMFWPSIRSISFLAISASLPNKFFTNRLFFCSPGVLPYKKNSGNQPRYYDQCEARQRNPDKSREVPLETGLFSKFDGAFGAEDFIFAIFGIEFVKHISP